MSERLDVVQTVAELRGTGQVSAAAADFIRDLDAELRDARAEVERLHDALNWLVHLYYGVSKGGDDCPITEEEWQDAIKQGRVALDEYDRQRAAQPREVGR